MAEPPLTPAELRAPKIRIALWIALPFLLFKLLLMSVRITWVDLAWARWLLPLLSTFVFVTFAVAGIEFAVRRQRLRGWRQIPCFAVCIVLGLGTVLFAGEFAEPLLVRIPACSRVEQVAVWPRSRTEPELADDVVWQELAFSPPSDSFWLHLNGDGNVASHKLTRGRLAWIGEEDAGISNIGFDPLSFGWSGDPADEEMLLQRIAPAGLPAEETEVLSEDIWTVLQQVESGDAVSSDSARISEVHSNAIWWVKELVGGLLWCVMFLFACAGVGIWTLQTADANP